MLESTQRLTSQDVLSTNKRTGPEHRSSWGYISVDRKGEDNVPASQSEKLVRRRSSSFLAVQSALFELNYISDFDVVKIGEGFFAEVFKVVAVSLLLDYVAINEIINEEAPDVVVL